ncbi:hypothetical protein U4T44_08175 [Klebsiella pneumoniae]
MHVVSRYTAAEAAATIDPRGRAIALSVVIAAGALLLIMPPVIGVTGTLSLLTALIAAFGVGWGFTRGQSWLYRSPLAATRWAFLLSAAGWLLALLTWHTAGGGRHGVCFAFAVLLDWALLGALMVRIRQQESAA